MNSLLKSAKKILKKQDQYGKQVSLNLNGS